MDREGRLTSAMAADDAVKKLAEQRILAHPFKHLATTIPFVWRGALLLFPVLLVALAYALRRRLDLGLFVLPAVGLLAFYALLSHFIPRYSVPALPAAIVAFLALAHAMWSRRENRLLH
jgi:lipopolysaccharide export LptBFGC system permease protein LptF